MATLSDDQAPAVAMDGAGRFVVVWMTFDADILGQRFASDGSSLGSEFQVNSYTRFEPSFPRVAAAPSGDFFVVWSDYGIVGQRYDSAGAPLGGEFLVSLGTTPVNLQQPAIKADASGRFVVIWEDSQEVIRGQRFDSAGAPLGTEFQVGTIPYDPAPVTVTRGSLGVADDGAFVVAWHRRIEPDGDSLPPTDVLARVYDSGGQPNGTEFVVNEKHSYNYLPDVDMSGAGDFVVTWSAYRRGSYGLDVFGRRYSSSGAPISGEFRVNSHLADDQVYPKIAFSNTSEFTVVWRDDPHMGANTDIRGGRFTTTITTPICDAGAIVVDVHAKLGKLGAPAGDEKLLLRGTLQFGPGTPAVLDPAVKGAQILVEDVGAGNAAIFELSTSTTPVPGGAGCGPDDGWKANGAGTTFTYKNKSGALPPGCIAGSANGLSLIKVKDKRAKGGGIVFKAKAKGATIPAVVGPLRVTLVLGATATESASGECGATPFDAADCSASGAGLKCAR
jgi:hypothetical protein